MQKKGAVTGLFVAFAKFKVYNITLFVQRHRLNFKSINLLIFPDFEGAQEPQLEKAKRI